MLRILQIITGLGAGGAERLLMDMVPHFDPDAFNVKIVSLSDDVRAMDLYETEGVDPTILDMSMPSGALNIFRLRSYIEKFRPHVIHAHMFHACVAAMLVRPFCSFSPALCFTSHNELFPPARKKILTLLAGYRDGDVVFSPGQHASMNASFTEVIPNGVPVAKLPPSRQEWSPEGPIKLLMVGRLVEAKDPVGLIRAFASLPLPEAILQIAGVGPLEAEAKAIVERMGLSKRVQFLGLRRDIRQVMASADIFLMHSRHEGMPMALLEAGAEAMPVVSTPVGAIPGILEHGRGFITTTEEFAETVLNVVRNPSAALMAGRALHKHVLLKHSISEAVRAHSRLYEKLSQRRDRNM